MGKVAGKVASWAVRLLIATVESRVRGMVKEEVAHLEKIMEARFAALNGRRGALENTVKRRFEAVNQR